MHATTPITEWQQRCIIHMFATPLDTILTTLLTCQKRCKPMPTPDPTTHPLHHTHLHARDAEAQAALCGALIFALALVSVLLGRPGVAGHKTHLQARQKMHTGMKDVATEATEDVHSSSLRQNNMHHLEIHDSGLLIVGAYHILHYKVVPLLYVSDAVCTDPLMQATQALAARMLHL